MTTLDFTLTAEAASSRAVAGCISAVEIHDPAPQQNASWSGGTSKTKPERPILNELHLFAGCGGGILGGILLGHHPVCAVEIEPYCRRVLLQRQRDGVLPRFPIWDDVRTFDGRPWRGRADVVCGGFPCQDISTAGGANRKGLAGERSGLWSEMLRIVCEVAPGIVFVENSPALTFRGLGTVLGQLAEVGYDAQWGVFSAGDVGARHERDRIWILGNRGHADQNAPRPQRRFWRGAYPEPLRDLQSRWWPAEARMGRKSDGVAGWMDRLAALGNGQVPAVAALAWRVLSDDARLRGMRVGLPKGEAVASEGRKYNGKISV